MEQDTLGLGLGTVATPELTVAVAATHNPLMLSPTSTDNTHPKLQNWVKSSFIFFYLSMVAEYQYNLRWLVSARIMSTTLGTKTCYYWH